MSGNPLIEVVRLIKKFGDVTAVNEISFSLNQGELFGFLGPNGAGKTTTINILTGLSRPDSGIVRVAGQNCTDNPKAAQHLIADLHRAGTTIFLTTHYIEEAERLCGRIAFIVKGRIVKTDSVRNLLQPLRGRHVMLISVSNAAHDLSIKLASVFPAHQFQSISSEQVRVESSDTIQIGPVIRFIEEQKAEILEARRLSPSLEDVFVSVTGIEAAVLGKETEKKGGGA